MSVTKGMLALAARCTFNPGDLSGNADRLLACLGLAKESDVPVASFVISAGGKRLEVPVQAGKYKTALFLMFLAGRGMSVCDDCRRSEVASVAFDVSGSACAVTRVYFGTEICDDAIENPETKHTSVQMLLLPSATVELVFK